MPAAATKAKQHKFKVSEKKDDQFTADFGGSFVAKCSCGFESEQRSSADRAERSGNAHLADVGAAPERESAAPAEAPLETFADDDD